MITNATESPTTPDISDKAFLTSSVFTGQKRVTSWMGTVVILLLVGFALLLLEAILHFGSVASSLAYLRGEGLIPDAYARSFGTVSKRTRPSVEFSLTNYTEQPIKVLGSNSSCTCLVTSDLPMVIPPSGRAILKVSARAKSRLGPYSERVSILTDSSESKLVLNVQGAFQ
jgi:Protein of unknown function (DUF1573)